MQNHVIAEQFFRQHLPQKLCASLNIEAIELESSTYIDEKLQETISDLIFHCPYDSSLQSADGDEAKICTRCIERIPIRLSCHHPWFHLK
jgi:hypothetical protein